MNALGNMSDAGKRIGNDYDHLKVNPGNPDNNPDYNGSPTYFLGLRKPLIAAINGAARRSLAMNLLEKFSPSALRLIMSVSGTQ